MPSGFLAIGKVGGLVWEAGGQRLVDLDAESRPVAGVHEAGLEGVGVRETRGPCPRCAA